MADIETSIGTLLDEIFAKYNSQISSLQSRIQRLESRISALESQSGITDVPSEEITLNQYENAEDLSAPLIEQSVSCNNDSTDVRDGSSQSSCDNGIIDSAPANAYSVFWATPQMWQGDIALRQNDDRSNAIFKVQFVQNEGFVEFNQNAFAFLSGQLEGLLLPFVEYEILSSGVPSSIKTIAMGSAQFDGNIWWLKKKAKVEIQ